MITFAHAHGLYALRLLLLPVVLVGTVAGCGEKVPEGQVVAVVNGEEVTRRNLAGEPQDGALAESEGGQAAIAAVLNGVIDRKLAVAEAHRLALDRTPQYVAQAKRLEEVMLSRTLFDRWATEVPKPNPRAIADFIARNPQRFDGRKLFLVDRIDSALDQDQSAALAPLNTNDEVVAYLKSQSKPFRRSRSVVDSAELPLALYRQMLALAPGYPLAIAADGGVAVMALIETRDAPLPSAERSAAAIRGLKQITIRQKLADLRKSAIIAYQPGFRPVAASPDRQGQQPDVMQ